MLRFSLPRRARHAVPCDLRRPFGAISMRNDRMPPERAVFFFLPFLCHATRGLRGPGPRGRSVAPAPRIGDERDLGQRAGAACTVPRHRNDSRRDTALPFERFGVVPTSPDCLASWRRHPSDSRNQRKQMTVDCQTEPSPMSRENALSPCGFPVPLPFVVSII